MASADIPCQHDIKPACLDSSYSNCPHCSLSLCLEHLLDHQLLVRNGFNEVIDQINQQKSTSSSHSKVIEMKAKALAALDDWKMTRFEAITSIYDEERARTENICEQCIDVRSNVQNRVFQELSTASSAIEKKKNIHPYDITQLKQKLEELRMTIHEIERNAEDDLTDIVTEVKLPEVIELEQELRNQTIIANKVQEYQEDINEKDRVLRTKNNEIRRLQQINDQKTATIEALKERLRKYK